MKSKTNTRVSSHRLPAKTILLLAGGVSLLSWTLSTPAEATPPPCGTGTRNSGGPARTFAAQGIRWRGNVSVRIGNRMHNLNTSVRTYYDICACSATNATARAIVTGLASARATLPQGCPPAAAPTGATDPTPPPPPQPTTVANHARTPPAVVTANPAPPQQPAPHATESAPSRSQPAPRVTESAPPPTLPTPPQGQAQGSLSQEASVYQANYSRTPTRTHQTCLASWNNPDERRFCHVELVGQNGDCPQPSRNGESFSGPYFRTSNPVGFCVAGDVNGWDYIRFGTADCRNLIPRMNGQALNNECWNLGNSNKTINVRQYRAKQEAITQRRLCSTGGISSRNCWIRKPSQTPRGLECDRTRGYVRTQTGTGEALCVKWANSTISGAPSCTQIFGPAVQATCNSQSWNAPQPE